jgi:guanine deaminase
MKRPRREDDAMDRFMKVAVAEARKGIACNDGGPFGAVVVRDGKIVAKGHNRVVVDNDPTAHGEIVAIRRAAKRLGTFDLSGCTIYTTAEPCPMCLWAISWANIASIRYGCSVADTEAIGFRDKVFYEMSAREIQSRMSQVDRDACLAVFADYAATEGKTTY